MLNEDHRDMLQAMVDDKVKFLVGAYALAAHGYPRATMGIDIWGLPVPDNADAVLQKCSTERKKSLHSLMLATMGKLSRLPASAADLQRWAA